jgi:hypothetical protein
MQFKTPEIIAALRGRLVVSCQTSADDPFQSPQSMVSFARAAIAGCAAGIRAARKGHSHNASSSHRSKQETSGAYFGGTGQTPAGTTQAEKGFSDMKASQKSGIAKLPKAE